MSNGALFVSFAESDGGHSYLAARAMLEPGQVGHLVFRNTVSETLDALIGGQSNLAVVPFYNSITQWEGATVKALATGQFEIFAQTCMPTSYVLAAHREHINIALSLYANERGIPHDSLADFTQLDDWIKARVDRFRGTGSPSAEECKKYEEREWDNAKDALKTYTRLLTTIYVGPQADEQYRGRLLRPDMNKVEIDLTRNPLRVLEEVNRSDLMKSIARGGSFPPQPGFGQSVSGGSINLGFPSSSALTDFKGPAALVAKGLMEPPGDLVGWDKQGSLGEIVALLRKLQVLLDVYSFGPPDLPDNKTQYLLLGRRGENVRPEFKEIADAHHAPLRTMILIKPPKVPGKDRWIKPRREIQERRIDPLRVGVVLDRPPLMVSSPERTVFLQEGGRLKSAHPAHPNIGELATRLRKEIDRKSPEGGGLWSSGLKFEAIFLGIYPTWLSKNSAEREAERAGKKCDDWLCAAAEDAGDDTGRIPSWVWRALGALILLALLTYAALSWIRACEDSDSFSCTGHVDWKAMFPPRQPPSETPAPPPSESIPTPSESTPSEPPPPASTATPAPHPYPTQESPPPLTAPPVIHTTPPVTHTAPPVAGPPPYAAPPEPVFHVPFFEAKANLLPEALTALRDAAMRAVETDKLVHLRIFALGPRETDGELWRRRLQAVKDELVRLGVPADRILPQGEGPYEVIIRQRMVPNTRTGRQRATIEVIPDPLAGDDD